MKKFLILIFCITITQTAVFALDVIYPKKMQVTINSPSTFFAGSADPQKPLTINGERVNVHPTGAFAKSVKLLQGTNLFKITSGTQTLTFLIDKKFSRINNNCSSFIKYDLPKTVIVTKNGAPLRATSVESGINRISHFQEGIKLEIDGEKNGLYRVVLTPSVYAWISKSNVKIIDEECENIFLYDYRSTEEKDFYIYEFALSGKTPFSVTEGDEMILKIYNIQNNIDNTATFNITLNQRLMGYDAYFKGNTLIFKLRKQPDINKRKPLKDIKIVIDAGHGGKELGAVGCLRNYEKDVNLEIARNLEFELKMLGADTLMTRSSDKFVSLNDRVKYTKEHKGLIFVSIHANSVPDCVDPNTRAGSSVFYYYDQAKPLADYILRSMTRNLPVKNDKVRQASFAVVRNTAAVSVLVETAYLVNPCDNALLIDKKFKQDCAKAIANGIKDYMLLK